VAEYRVAAADALQHLGRHDDALLQLEQALAQDPLNRTAPLMQIRILLAQGKPKKALARAETFAGARQDNPYALNALGLAQLAVGDEAKARATFVAALDADPGFPDAALNLAKLDLRTGDTQGARELLERVVAAAPDNVDGILALADLDASSGDVRGQQRRLRAAVEALPNELRLRLALARSYLGNGAPERARIAVQAAPETMRQQPELMLVNAQAQAAAGDLDAAVETLQILRLKAPDSATPQLLIATVYAEQGNLSEMEVSLVTGASMDPDSPLLRSALKRALDQYKDPAQQLALLDRLLAATDASPRVIAAKVDLLTGLGEYRHAERLMRGLFSRYPDDVGVMRKLVGVQRAGNDGAAAREVLTDWLARHPDDATAQVMLAQVQAELGETDAARKLLQGLMASANAYRADPLILNNLAWLLRDSDPGRALGYAERALRADPSSAAIKDTLGLLLVRSGHLPRGLKLLEEAKIANPTDPSIGFHYALALSKADRGAEARVILLGLANKDFPEQEAAQKLLAQLAN
jgi:putative PEP-CTERM system TPR-repeat lipoprotein